MTEALEHVDIMNADDEEASTVAEASSRTVAMLKVLLFPELLPFVEFEQLVRHTELSKAFRDLPQQTFYYVALCVSYAGLRGLWTPLLLPNSDFPVCMAKKHLFEELLFSKQKWVHGVQEEGGQKEQQQQQQHQQSFKVSVAARFRPGLRGEQSLNLPLHQFLKVRRHQLKETAAETEASPSPIVIGEQDPQEYVDPFLHALMRDPVLLTSSNGICERSVALQSMLRRGRDPFNNAKLTQAMIVPQPELLQQIQAWRLKKEEARDVSLKRDEVKKALVDGSPHIDPNLLDVLMEAEKLGLIASKAERDAITKKKKMAALKGKGEEGVDGDAFDADAVDADAAGEEEAVAGGGAGGGGLSELWDAAAALEGGGEGGGDENAAPHNINGADSLSNSSSRPLKGGDSARIVGISETNACVSMAVSGAGVKPFHFNAVFDQGATQSKVYDVAAKDSVTAVLNGFNACLLCYGQTGSGKTHTFFGAEGVLDEETVFEQQQQQQTTTVPVPKSAGLVVRACNDILLAAQKLHRRGVNVSISCQYVEIFEETLTDLLTGNPVQVKRETGELVGAYEAILGDMKAVLEMLRLGQARKRFAATAMNERSSRSHTALVLLVTQIHGESIVKSQLQMVDLAGSERIKKSLAEGERRREAIGINSSLLVLGKCIAALVEEKKHIPYLESKLTTMLRAALGGNSRTLCIVASRSDDENGDETLQSMRFGERVKCVSNSTIAAASSVETALASLNASLAKVQEQIAGLRARKLDSVESFGKLVLSAQGLERRRDALAMVVAK